MGSFLYFKISIKKFMLKYILKVLVSSASQVDFFFSQLRFGELMGHLGGSSG